MMSKLLSPIHKIHHTVCVKILVWNARKLDKVVSASSSLKIAL